MSKATFLDALASATEAARKPRGPSCYVCALDDEKRGAVNALIAKGKSYGEIARGLQALGVTLGPDKRAPQVYHVREHAAKGHQ